MFTQASLFSGIGGFDLAAEWAGWENIFHCENNKFGQKILNYYWPKAIIYGDITTTDFTIHRGTIDVLTGGFPCQPYSVSGKRKGNEDSRHLWPEMLRAIREIAPPYVVGENVPGIISWKGGLVFNEVQTDLENEGYEVQPVVLPACGVNAPHRRDRVLFVAYNSNARLKNMQQRENRILESKFITNTESKGSSGLPFGKIKKNTEYGIVSENGDASDTLGFGLRRQSNRYRKSVQFDKNGKGNDWTDFPTQSPVCSGNDGFSTELVRQRIRTNCLGLLSEKEINKIISKAITEHRKESIKAYGNAIVPQVAFQIFKAINMHEHFLNVV